MRVLIIEDHPVTVIGLEYLFKNNFKDIELQYASDGSAAKNLIVENEFGFCVLDIFLPNTDTHALMCFLQKNQPNCKILIYSNSPEKIYSINFIKMGARGFLNKSVSTYDFVIAVKAILSGQIFFPENVLPYLIFGADDREKVSVFDKLTPREVELYNQLVQGKSSKDIGTTLSIEPSTVATLKSRLLKKLNLNSVYELIQFSNEFNI